MSSLGILVKSHLPDLPYAERLIASLHRHNLERLPVFLVVAQPADFAHLAGPDVAVLPESDFAEHLTTQDVAGFDAGYINQEVVKLCFWETGLVDNYLCLDSDAEFVRDFGAADFMADATTPFTFLSEDAALRAEPRYYREHWALREPRLRVIQEEIGVTGDRLLTVHGQAVFSSAVLRSFRDDFLIPRGWDYLDALALAPYEPTWYSLWLQHARPIPLIPREPVFKTFHNADQHLDYVLRGLGSADVARGYVGVIVNSNYSRGDGVVGFDDDRAATLASYVPETVLLRSAVRGVLMRLRRRPTAEGRPAPSG